MKKGEIYEGTVERIDFPAKGIVRCGEHTVVIKNTVPGQRIRFSITKARKGKCEGRLLEILEHSGLECAPQCPHFEFCGGCTWQNLPYPVQLSIKEEQVRNLLKPVIPEEIFEGITSSPQQFGYRNKMEFTFGDTCKDGPLVLGLHRRGSFYDIEPVTQCRLVDEDIHQILHVTQEFARRTGLPYFHRRTHEGYFRHLLVRKASKTGEILLALVTSSQAEFDLSGWVTEITGLKLNGSVTGILHVVNDSLADIIQADSTRCLYGTEYFYEELLGLRFRITPFSFFQTNTRGAEILYQTVREYIQDISAETIFDLYSGTGTIAQVLAPAAGHVTGIEIIEEAVEAARKNARENGLSNCEFLAGDVLKILDQVQEKPDLIILDPPRDGIHPKALEKIIRYGAPRIVYISCKPTSLVRDLAILQEEGYRAQRVRCVDLFPGTSHVETVAQLSRGDFDKTGKTCG